MFEGLSRCADARVSAERARLDSEFKNIFCAEFPLSTLCDPLFPLPPYNDGMHLVIGGLGWGAIIYAVVYTFWSATLIYGLSSGFVALCIRLLVMALITIVAARSLGLSNWKSILEYSVVWALTAIALDAVLLVPFSGWALYASWSVWVGYLLVVLFPLLSAFFHRKKLVLPE